MAKTAELVLRRARWIAVALALSGCDGGGPRLPLAPVVGGDTGGPVGVIAAVELDAASVSVGTLSFLPGELCEGDEAGTIVLEGPTPLALLGADHTMTEPVLDPGRYCGMRIERAPDGEGVTLSLDGFTLDGARITVRSSATTPLVFAERGWFAMTEDEDAVLVFVDESALFAAIDLDATEREADGSIELSDARNAAQLAALEAQLPAALALYRDDGDGRLSADERREGPIAPGR